jgi:hypothetical protein
VTHVSVRICHRRDITGETHYAWLGYPKRVNPCYIHERRQREDSFSVPYSYTEAADSEAEHETSISLGAENLTSVDSELKSCLRVRVTD